MARQAERFSDERRNEHRPIADDQHSIDRRSLRGRDHGGDGRRFLVEPNRDRRIAPRIFDHVAAIGREDQLHPEPRGRIAERAGLIPRRRGK